MVKISVVMPVYNTPVPFLKEAVESILNQTEKQNVAFILEIEKERNSPYI